MSKARRGKLMLGLGVLLLCAAVGIYAIQQRQDRLAGENARMLLSELSQTLVLNDAFLQFGPDVTWDEEDEPVRVTYSGYPLLGSVKVDSCGIELPVLSQWSYELLKVAPCRYSGSIAGEDLILMGHNYKSHFTPLNRAGVGDEVVFTDAAGSEYRYSVSAIETLHKTELERLTGTEYPLTLFTCTYGGQDRLVLRCEMTE